MNTHLFSVIGEVVPQWTKLSKPFEPNYNCAIGQPIVIAQSWINHNASKVRLFFSSEQINFNSAKVISADLSTSDVKVYAKTVSGNFYESKKLFYNKLTLNSGLTKLDTYRASWGQPIAVKSIINQRVSFDFTDLYAPHGEIIQTLYVATHMQVVDYVTHPDSDDMGFEYVDTKKLTITSPARIRSN